MTQPSPLALDQVFSALAHAKRRDIIGTLAYRPATIDQLAREHGMSLPAIHKHLTVLEKADFIQRKKVGRTNFIALNRVGLKAAQQWTKQFHTAWGSNSETLENYLANLTSK